MKIKTSELSDEALGWAVAEALDLAIEIQRGEVFVWLKDALGGGDALLVQYQPWHRWAQGGPIIHREGIGFYKANGSKWWAHPYGGEYTAEGPTALIAAMRCYVSAKLGDEVDIPEELLR